MVVEPLAERAIIENKKGKRYFDLQFFTHLKWVYQAAIIGGWFINRLPKGLIERSLNFVKKLGFDFSKLLMTGLPHQNFEKGASMIFLPESQNIEIRTSDGKMVVPHQLVIEMLKRVCAYDPNHSIAQIYY